MSKIEPGQMAMIRYEGREYAAHRGINDWRYFDPATRSLVTTYRNEAVTVVRPLVVIDPDEEATASRLLESLDGMSFATHACGARSCLQAALRSLIAPPKPAEPQGLGAVVEDASGLRWVLVYEKGLWQSRQDANSRSTWEGVDAVRILSAGWSE